MGSELVSTDIAMPETSPMKSEVDIKKEPKEHEESAASGAEVKSESDETKPKVEDSEGAEVKTEPSSGRFFVSFIKVEMKHGW